MSAAISNQVIFCSFCGFSAFRTRDVVNHLSIHSFLTLACGVDGCTREYRNLKSFKTHLTRNHGDFYPDILHGMPFFESNSVFAASGENINSYSIDHPALQDYNIPDHSFSPDYSPNPLITSPLNEPFFNLQESIDISTRNFLKILIEKGLFCFV